MRFVVDERRMHEIMSGPDSTAALKELMEFLSDTADADPGVQAMKRDTLGFADSHLQELLYRQRDSALGHYGLPIAAEVCTDGITYLTWPAQFKVSGITVVDLSKITEKPEDMRFDTPYAGLHHDGEYVIRRKYAIGPRQTVLDMGPYFSAFPLLQVPGRDELRQMAYNKAIDHGLPL